MVPPDPPFSRVSRFPHGYRNISGSSGVGDKEELDKQDRRLHIPSSKDFMIPLDTHKMNEFVTPYGVEPSVHSEDEMRTSVDIIFGAKDVSVTNLEVIDGERDTMGETVEVGGCKLSGGDEEYVSSAEEIMPRYPVDDVSPMYMFPDSSHRDGSIYRGTDIWKKDYRIADRNETFLEAMMQSDITDDCIVFNGICIPHSGGFMLQIFSLKLAKIPVEGASVELYGYIAVRDDLDPLLNYVVNFSRDDPITLEQGSLIKMSGPKRGIDLYGTILIEYDMKIKVGKQEKDDLQLIDGVSFMDDIDIGDPCAVTSRIHGVHGAVDITASRFNYAVEATVQVFVSEVQDSFDLRLGCFVSGIPEEIWLFDGTIGESCGLKRSVVAVLMNTWMDLKFRVGADSSIPVEHCCSFKANMHGHAIQMKKTDFALITVKVIWSALIWGRGGNGPSNLA